MLWGDLTVWQQKRHDAENAVQYLVVAVTGIGDFLDHGVTKLLIG